MDITQHTRCRQYIDTTPGGEVEQTERGEGEHAGHGRGSLHVDAGQQGGHLTNHSSAPCSPPITAHLALPRPHHEQPAGRQQGAVNTAEGGAGHEHCSM